MINENLHFIKKATSCDQANYTSEVDVYESNKQYTSKQQQQHNDI